MLGTLTDPRTSLVDSSRSALEFVHRLLTSPGEEQPDLAGLLGELTAAFTASGAGLAVLPDGIALASYPVSASPSPPLPWHEQTDLIEQALHARTALSISRTAGGSYLLSALSTAEGGWLLWLEDAGRMEWSAGEASALLLAGQILSRRLTSAETRPNWVEQIDRGVRRQRLEAAARLVRRLAHDFGNVLTGILGFSELALAQQVSSHSPLHTYLTEIYRGAQNGAHYVNQLRQFARRQASGNRTCGVAAALTEEEKRLLPLLGPEVQLQIDLRPDLPDAALDAEQLRQLLGIALDNAREALSGPGTIAVSAQTIQVSAAEARNLFGDVRPGTCLEITIADNGVGLTPDAQRQLFAEPFFTTKPRKRGFGLAIAYGILSAHRGGLDLLPRAEGGTLVRIVLPTAPQLVASGRREPASEANTSRLAPAARQEPPVKVLVVDDDLMIRQFVTTTLERTGYRVQAVASAEAALRAYTESVSDPFRLVLSDVLLSETSGIDLAKRLRTLDAHLRIVLMSGQAPADFAPRDFAVGQFDLLSKPFRPEGLVRAVRTALAERGSRIPNTSGD